MIPLKWFPEILYTLHFINDSIKSTLTVKDIIRKWVFAENNKSSIILKVPSLDKWRMRGRGWWRPGDQARDSGQSRDDHFVISPGPGDTEQLVEIPRYCEHVRWSRLCWRDAAIADFRTLFCRSNRWGCRLQIATEQGCTSTNISHVRIALVSQRDQNLYTKTISGTIIVQIKTLDSNQLLHHLDSQVRFNRRASIFLFC